MKEVKLTVKGPVGSGKTRVIMICEDALIAAGYVVSKINDKKRGEESVEVRQA